MTSARFCLLLLVAIIAMTIAAPSNPLDGPINVAKGVVAKVPVVGSTIQGLIDQLQNMIDQIMADGLKLGGNLAGDVNTNNGITGDLGVSGGATKGQDPLTGLITGLLKAVMGLLKGLTGGALTV